MTEQGENSDTISFREHMTSMLAEMDLRFQQRVAALDSLTDAKFVTFRTLIDSQAEKVALALASADKAVTKAEAATERRFESVNEFRKTLSDQTSSFPSRVELSALAERVSDLATRMDKTEGRGVGLNAGWVYLLGGLAAIGTIVSLFIAFAN